jgi:hypothetical protein
MKSALLGASAATALLAAAPAFAGGPTFTYVPDSLIQSTIISGPWVLHEPRSSFGHDASGIVPSGGMPYAGYCTRSGPEKNHGPSLMQPYYFPFVQPSGPHLQGFFDYRPRNEQEAMVSAFSNDWGATWHFTGMALALNPYCPSDPSDPNNNNIIVNGVQTAYASNPDNAADNGLGHPFVMTVNGVARLYQLNRANGHIDHDQLVVHTAGFPAYGYVSPLVNPAAGDPGGYPALTPGALPTAGLQSPDAILGAVPMGNVTAVIYVEKQLKADNKPPYNQPPYNYQVCPPTPPFALTNLINGTPRSANHDVTTVRVATTTDGLNFTDVGKATGLFDPSTIDNHKTRYLGSGSIIRLANGHYGMFFGGGNCLDNDSDAFHYLGYAETQNVVKGAADLQSWTVFNDLDHPILSTDTVTGPSPIGPIPANPPVVNVTGSDALTPAQVAPWTPPSGYNTNFFSGRAYGPQALYTDASTLTIVFAGYNTPQPSNNLGDYRTIGRFQLQVPTGYFSPN